MSTLSLNSLNNPTSLTLASRARRRKQGRFLRAYRAGIVLKECCKLANISERQYLRWQREDPLFQAHYLEAQDTHQAILVAALEKELYRRAVTGVKTPIVNQGRIVTHVMKHSDKLLELALRANHPEKYNPKSQGMGVEIGVDNDGNKHVKAYIGFNPEDV